ncbi:PQQ-dependent dehydrogenase, methanol/ethanol family [Parerythrobacter aestuarii]|uniref:PQQ-dependent dehydrogenase, methanol/ethanol family n=1 Tax=Parerythrobacter aestuarii TaxID=3020909 RepID=UPI0024DE6BEA|nr:PQQ-dependent dehydrogenase, methanol/ethanol family [Parerythrobacter aestuarii]
MRHQLIAAITALALAACSSGPERSDPATEGVTDAMIAAAPDAEWLSYGRDYGEQRFSPLTQINAENVGELGLAWSYDLDTARGQEATPIMHDGTLYITSAWSKVFAFDAASGELKWKYDPEVPRDTLVRACCDAVNRGVAIYGDRVFVATLDGRLVGLDRETGKVDWEKTVVPNQEDYTITGAPRIANGLVLIGSGGAEYKARGYIAAYDHGTGEEVWKFYTVPGNPADGFENEAMEKAAETWGGEWWKLGGGGTVWDSITYDPKTNLVLFGTGNAEPWNPGANDRGSGDSLYTGSIVAVDADTGEYRWHFQETPEDRWDYDSNAQITLADLEIDGKLRHVALHAPKNGYFYVLDAETGEFLSAGSFAPQNWTTGIDPKTGKPTINPEARYENSGAPWIGLPGAGGAHSWQPMSFSPDTGLVYIPVNLAAFPFMADDEWAESDIGFQTGQASAAVAMPAIKEVQQEILSATTGALVAWDPVAQKEAWRVDYVGPWNGGTLATAGNLVFQGDARGDFAAFTADKGSKLWSFNAQSGVIAAPMTYSIDGEQYVAVLAGWGGVWDVATGILANKSGPMRNISRLLVFKLGAKGELGAPPALADMVLDPPAFTGTEEQVKLGSTLYGRYCSVCHGDAAVAGALNPDLRHSATLGSSDAIKAIVIDGALQHNGMVSFAKALQAGDAEAIRQYLIKRANEDKALEGS